MRHDAIRRDVNKTQCNTSVNIKCNTSVNMIVRCLYLYLHQAALENKPLYRISKLLVYCSFDVILLKYLHINHTILFYAPCPSFSASLRVQVDSIIILRPADIPDLGICKDVKMTILSYATYRAPHFWVLLYSQLIFLTYVNSCTSC